jgi:hypothetical protein
MKGCILFGRFVWSVEEKNRPLERRAARRDASHRGVHGDGEATSKDNAHASDDANASGDANAPERRGEG